MSQQAKNMREIMEKLRLAEIEDSRSEETKETIKNGEFLKKRD